MGTIYLASGVICSLFQIMQLWFKIQILSPKIPLALGRCAFGLENSHGKK